MVTVTDYVQKKKEVRSGLMEMLRYLGYDSLNFEEAIKVLEAINMFHK